jgi:xanthine/uracil permease
MAVLKSLLTFMLVGTLLGNQAATYAAPHFMAWYNETPLASQTVCNLPQVVRQVTSELIQAQLIGSGIGAAVFLVLGILVVRARARKQRPQPPAAPSPQAPLAP